MRWRRSASSRWSKSRGFSRIASATSCERSRACRCRIAATIRRPSVNIRGLQDFGRVAVVVDGARQNYQRSGHNANGSFFLDPELIGGIDVVRGPTANIYGSGAIGGVASFRTKDIEDVVRPGERWGIDIAGMGGSNQARGMALGVRRHPPQSARPTCSAARSIATTPTTRTASGTDRQQFQFAKSPADCSSSPRARGTGTRSSSAASSSSSTTASASPIADRPRRRRRWRDRRDRRSTIRPCRTTWARSTGATASRTTTCSTGTRTSTATAPRTTRPRPTTTASPPAAASARWLARQQHLRLRRRQARLSARYDRRRRLQHLALRRSATGAMR